MNHEELTTRLKQLKLPSMAIGYVEVAKIAEKEKSTYETYLGKLVAGELAEKHAARVKRLLKDARIILPKTLDTYDFGVRTGITAKQIKRLGEGDFIRESSNSVFYGSFGLGKTHLALSLTQMLCEKGFRCYFSSTHRLIDDLQKAKHNLELASLLKRLDRFDLICCDELGYCPHDQAGADLFFQLISQRYERKSMLFTTNLTYSEWDKVFINPLSTAAAVDRIIHKCETYNIGGPSWRAEQAKKKKSELTTNVTTAIQ